MLEYDIISYCDAYPAIGMGHIGRQIGILNELIEADENIAIALKGKYSNNALKFIAEEKDKKIDILLPSDSFFSHIAIVDTMFIPGETNIDYDFFANLSHYTDKIIFIWDALNVKLPEEVDIYINHLPYAITVKSREDQTIYSGFSYLPVQSKYFYSINYDVNGDILFVIGGSDKPNNLRILLNTVEELSQNRNVTMIFSPSYDAYFINLLKTEHTNIEILQNVDDLMPYFNKAAAIITTYGSTSFQALAAKRPVFTFGLVGFQDFYGSKLEEKGYSVNLGLLSSLNLQKLTYLTNDNFLKEKQSLLSKVFIEPGIKNIIEIIKNQLD